MGYTHYWNFLQWTDADRQGLERALPAIRDVLRRYADIIAWEHDRPERLPEAGASCIRFNGRGEDGHETFYFKPNERNFCKTARKPYDLPVCEILLILAAHLPSLRVDSDGFAVTLPPHGKNSSKNSTRTDTGNPANEATSDSSAPAASDEFPNNNADATSALADAVPAPNGSAEITAAMAHKELPLPDESWPQAAANIRYYGIACSFAIVKRRPPYADLALHARLD